MNRFRLSESNGPHGQTRRQWLASVPVAAGAAALAWQQPGQNRALADMTAQDAPLITGCHIGYRPDSRKRILVRSTKLPAPAQLTIAHGEGPPRTFPIGAAGASAFDPCASPVFLDLPAEGSYRVSLGSGEPFSFPVAGDAWGRMLPLLAGYAHYQRCGHSDRASHATCHLDDARRRDTGMHVDTTGGWHDAGDTRKWVDATLMNLFGLTALARNYKGHPESGPLSMAALLNEARFGNAFFLKMQDSDGLVWADVGGGIRGDNSDNHWTDNAPGTSDDRWINVEKRTAIQAMFVAAQATMAQIFAKSDPGYSATCLTAAWRCWKASRRQGSNTTDVAWWTLAAVEMSAATGQIECRQEVIRLANQLTNLQIKNPGGTGMVRGFFPMWVGNPQPLRDAVHSALPAIALLHAAQSAAARSSSDAKGWSNAVRLYLDEYAAPMAARSAYAVLPFGLFLDAPAEEKYRPLSGRYSYRFFMPTKTKAGFSGLSSHLLSHAALFAEAERHFGQPKYREMAYSHLEWVFGANPFGASLVTGAGFHQPPAFSPFVGLIPGGIMNGICGNEEDQPVLNQENARDWHTNEYWSPHSGYCQWALSVLETPRSAEKLT